MDRRYQVFVSSTYADLKEERQRVIQTLMEADCIPAGMELFPAADEEQFAFIKKVIDDCDYYLVIIGGRYGSVTPDGVSYTEKEYDYAVSGGLKVIALIHENPDAIPLAKSEKEPLLRERLRQFREKVARGRLVRTWKSADELPGLVALSLTKTIKTFPAVGWVRANKAASEDLLSEINELRKLTARLQKELAEASGAARQEIPDLAGLDEEMLVHGTYHNTQQRRNCEWDARVTWRSIFGYVSPYLLGTPKDEYVKKVLDDALFTRSDKSKMGYGAVVDDQDFRTISIQLKALGLVKIQHATSLGMSMGLFWDLTPAGERLMMEIRTVRAGKATQSKST